MISWSEKTTLDNLLVKVGETIDADSALEALFDYLSYAQSIDDVEKNLWLKRTKFFGLCATETKLFIELVKNGAIYGDDSLFELFGNIGDLATYSRTKDGCRIIGANIGGVISGIEVSSERPLIVFDVQNQALYLHSDATKSVTFDGVGSKASIQFLVSRAVRAANGKPIKTSQIAKKYDLSSSSVRDAIAGVNQNFSAKFQDYLIVKEEGISRENRYILNPKYDYK